MRRSVAPLLMLALALLPLTQALHAQEDDETGAQSLFINLTRNEPNRARMAIMLARRVHSEKGIPTTIWLNVEGVRLLDGSLAQPHFEGEETPLKQLEAFMQEGGTVMVCPMCLKGVGGMTKDDLPAGVILSEMEVFWKKAFADDVTVLSY